MGFRHSHLRGGVSHTPKHVHALSECMGWLRTNEVDTNGAAAKVMDFDGLGKKGRPGTFGKIKVG